MSSYQVCDTFSPLIGGLFNYALYIIKHMFIPSESEILIAVIGGIGIIGSFVVLTYGFVRRPLY